jgi:transitional endoplasmic reticulum ATPase
VAQQQANPVTPTVDDPYGPLAALWTLRLLCRTEAKAKYLKNPAGSDAINELLGYTPPEGKPRPEELSRLITSRLQELENEPVPKKGPLFRNIQVLAELLNLSPVEQDILGFRLLMMQSEALRDAAERYGGDAPDLRLRRILAIVLGISLGEAAKALQPDGALLASGILKLDEVGWNIRQRLSPMRGLAATLFAENASTDEVIAFAARPATSSTLGLGDFIHVGKEVDLLCRYLRRAMDAALPGVNILLHGLPGVGKTELVKVIAREAGLALFEVNMADSERKPLKAQERLEAYLVNQRLLARQGSVAILFDEIEDVMPDTWSLFRSEEKTSGQHKAWTNRVLEENHVPAFWIANKVTHIDPAFLRRFDYIMELRNPPISKRLRILETSLKGLDVLPGWLEQQAREERLTPAFTDRAARVLRAAGVTDPADVVLHFEHIVRSQLEARGDAGTVRYPHPENYSLDLVSASKDLSVICDSLAKRPKGRLLLYGPPGSGKTAFAHHLAQAVGKPLVLKRASDLISKWLGETEKNLARMFRDAAGDEAVLLLDEADSFLQERQRAVRSWEVSEVNELLTQMECFGGLFLCATNFRENLDSAALRRFGLKIRFDYLNPEQSWLMFIRTLAALGGGSPSVSDTARIQRELSALRNLTPGDFNSAKQRYELLGEAVSVDGFLEALQEESRLKPDGNRRPIGFAGTG